jgi:hypothetical protein
LLGLDRIALAIMSAYGSGGFSMLAVCCVLALVVVVVVGFVGPAETTLLLSMHGDADELKSGESTFSRELKSK